ncbi:MAG TPA: HD domain-containing phosphohydrolase [Ktedonobacterales bacterium]|nr:HD domain-containing phosphohydrolase [Ktedonobacterales bacterium]
MALVEHMSAEHRIGAQRIVQALAASIRERDRLTYEHSRRVATYAQRLAHALAWPRKLAYDLALAALVHDLGKTWIENDVLYKESALSVDELDKMRQHPVVGARMLEMYGASHLIVDAVRHHHEAFDGTGYPDRLAGDAIPIAARLLAVADTFDAVTSERPYKPALDCRQAAEIIRRGVGANFDPQVAGVFLGLLESGPDFLVPRHATPLPPALPTRQSIWLHDDIES